jgi:hypothetical protein
MIRRDFDETEATLQAFHEVHARRLQSSGHGASGPEEELVVQEREAICRHADAVRAHAERLAKCGR